jgi:spore coat protein A, manganese oxidase
MDLSRRAALLGAGALGAGVLLRLEVDGNVARARVLPPARFTDPLAIPPVVDGTAPVSLRMVRTEHRFSSAFPGTSPALAYQLEGTGGPTYLGPTIVARSGVPTTLTVTHDIVGHPLASSIDTTLHGVRPQDAAQPRASVHLHGGNTRPEYDGGPLDTYPATPGDHQGAHPQANPLVYEYDNSQDAAGLWYHDHALGITRLNVHAGLAAGYLVRDPDGGVDDGSGTRLPAGAYEVPLVLQDKAFDRNGSMLYPAAPWVPEAFGDIPVVNGTAYPVLEVDRGIYRFRVFGGSNARVFDLTFQAGGRMLPFWQIGGDGGLLDTPVPMSRLLLTPGERADLLVDFSGWRPGTVISLRNAAVAPYPSGPRARGRGAVPLPEVMRFQVGAGVGWQAPVAGLQLRPGKPVQRLDSLAASAPVRTHSLVEIMDAGGAVMMGLIDNRMFHSDDYLEHPVAPTPDSLQVWEFVNTTADTHPIHLHLVQFQVLNREAFDVQGYLDLAGYVDPQTGMIEEGRGEYPAPPATGLTSGQLILPAANEMGWKDTVAAPPGMVTRIAVPFGTPAGLTRPAARQVFRGDYVWHCHILDHEDNDMMQRYRID